MSLQQSTAQTFGPYFAIGLKRVEVGIPADAAQLKLIIRGRVLDGDGKPVGDAAIETWQANLQGRYPAQPTFGAAPAHADLTGLGRAPTDAEGRFEIHTYKPGPVPGPGGALQAPHILVAVGMRGLLRLTLPPRSLYDRIDESLRQLVQKRYRLG